MRIMCGVRLPKLVTDSVRGTEKCLSGVTLELVVTDSTKVTEARLSAESMRSSPKKLDSSFDLENCAEYRLMTGPRGNKMTHPS